MTNNEQINERYLKPEAVRKMLGSLASGKGDSASLYSLPVNGELEEQLSEKFKLPGAVKVLAQRSGTGFAVFYTVRGSEIEYSLIIPPFPVKAPLVTSYVETAPLLEMLEHEYVLGVVLIRLGSFAFGVSRGQNLITSKVGTGLVHGRHRKGGSSANRFARRREKQMEVFFTRACNYLREYFEPHVKEIDYMLYGGAKTTIQEFRKQCSFVGALKQPELPSLLDLPDPRQAVLHKALEKAWSSRVLAWTCQREPF